MLNTTATGPSIAEIDIQRLEQRRSMTLPSDYRRFLLLRNGGRPERDLFFASESKSNLVARINFFLSIGDPDDAYDLDRTLDAVADRIEKGFLPIAVTWRGNYICLEVERDCAGHILFWDGHMLKGENVYPIANSFTEFIESLFRDENSPKLNVLS
jgi:hypothetical protein